MKKIIKVTFVILTLCCICFAFSSCNRLDEMRANQGLIKDNGAVIVVGGSEYVPMPELESGYEWLFTSDNDYDNTCNITKDDVPVLLSEILGLSSPFYNGRDVIYYSGNYYVVNDKYEEYNAKIDYSDFGYYSLSYQLYNKETGFYSDKTYTLSTEEYNAVERGLSEENKISGDIPDGIQSYTKGFYQTNKDGSIVKNQYSEEYINNLFEITVIYLENGDKKVYIQKYDEVYVPSEEDADIFIGMFEALGIEEEYYYYGYDYGYDCEMVYPENYTFEETQSNI